jgi:hypothetical protein
MMGWYFLPFDDQLDGVIGQSPRRVAQITGALITIVHGESITPRMQSPTVRAFTDLWCRMTRQMTPTLLARLRYHWSCYFSSQVTEAIDRLTGYTYTDLQEYFTLRAATTCAFGQNDLAEKWGGTEVPAPLWHHPVLARMRQLGADLVAIRNDSMSTPHEDVAGLHNAICILERTRQCSRTGAISLASQVAQDKIGELAALEEQALPRLARGLDPEQHRVVLGYADIIHNWILGDYEWEQSSARNQQYRQRPDWAYGLLAAEE